MSVRSAPNRRAGFTLIELVIVAAIVGLVVTNGMMLFRTSSDVVESDLFVTALEDQASQTMDRIALALMASSEEVLGPVSSAPGSSPLVDYWTSLGVDAGEVIWSNPERIEHVSADGEIVWSESPGTPEERRLVWSRWIPDYFANEDPNGLDDNENELIDEQGLSFTKEGGKLLIRLTLSRTDSEGVRWERFLETRVTCRN